MKTKFLVTAAVAFAAVPIAAKGAITVIGSSAARMCYEAAVATSAPSRGNIEDCDQALTQADLSTRDTVATHVNRGILRSRKADADITGALADFDRALALDANEPEAYLNKALVLTMRTNQAGQALPLFTAALERKTRRPELAYYGRAAANEQIGDVKAAYVDYRNAVSLAPKWDAPKLELARFSVRRNK